MNLINKKMAKSKLKFLKISKNLLKTNFNKMYNK